jgi:NADPH:quinone reductase-like Zn-dependent oxidoreductase
MKAAIVVEAGATPVYGDFREPVPGPGEVRVAVRAAALSELVKSRASGRHYSGSTPPPFVVGIDGVGVLDDGRRVYFALPSAPFGSMSERTIVRRPLCVPVPDNLDSVRAAALANPGISSWAALKERAHLAPGESVLVNGATGTAGRLALGIAKHLGARRVIATGRDADALHALRGAGADVAIPLGDGGDAFEAAVQEQFEGDGVDVVLDYLWGPSAERILVAAAKAGRDPVPVRFVQIGAVSAPTITLPSAVLRSSSIELMGSGLGSVPVDRLASSVGELLRAAVTRRFTVETRAVPLSEVAQVWGAPLGRPRIVFEVP